MSESTIKKQRKIWKKEMAEIAGKDFNKYINDMESLCRFKDKKIRIRNIIIFFLAVILLGSITGNILFSLL